MNKAETTTTEANIFLYLELGITIPPKTVCTTYIRAFFQIRPPLDEKI